MGQVEEFLVQHCRARHASGGGAVGEGKENAIAPCIKVPHPEAKYEPQDALPHQSVEQPNCGSVESYFEECIKRVLCWIGVMQDVF